MDAQTQLAAELYKTLNDAQKQEVCNMIDTLLSQQLNDQQSLDSHSAATENQDSLINRLAHPALSEIPFQGFAALCKPPTRHFQARS